MENRQKRRSAFDRFSEWLFKFLRIGFWGRFFVSYDNANERFLSKMKKRGDTSGTKRRRMARMVENGFLTRGVKQIFTFLMKISLRDYGIMLFTMGAIVSVLFLLNDMVLFLDVSFRFFIYGLVVCASSLPLMFSSKSLASNILASRLMSFLIFDLLGFDRDDCRIVSEQNRVTFTNISLLIGILLGVLACFISPLHVCVILLSVVLAYATLRIPETGAIIIIFMLPFASTPLLCVCVAYTFLCYIFKCAIRKRELRIEYIDLWIIIAICTMALFGINIRHIQSSLIGILVNMCMALSYFLFSNITRSKEWFKRCALGITLSTLLVSIIGIMEALLGKLAEAFEALEPIFKLEGNISSTMNDPGVFAALLILALPFGITRIISERREITRFGGATLSFLIIAAMLLTGSRVGILGLVVGVLLVLMLFNRNYVYLTLIVAIGIPVLISALPDSVIAELVSLEIFEGFSFSEKLTSMKDAFLVSFEHPLGIGIVNAEVYYPDISPSGFDSLPIRMLVQYGIVGSVVFFITGAMFIRLMFSYAVKAKNQYRKINASAGFCSAISLCVSGIFSDVLADSHILLLFIVILSLSYAYIKLEREENVAYEGYVDFSRASLDIMLDSEGVYESAPRKKYVHTIKNVKKKSQTKAEVKEFSNAGEFIRVSEEENIE